MATAAELSENSHQEFETQKPLCIGVEGGLSRNMRWGCGHIYDETPVGIAVYVRNDPINHVDPTGNFMYPNDLLAPPPPPFIGVFNDPFYNDLSDPTMDYAGAFANYWSSQAYNAALVSVGTITSVTVWGNGGNGTVIQPIGPNHGGILGGISQNSILHGAGAPQLPGLMLNVQDMVNWLLSNAQSQSSGQCARYVRLALKAGGINTIGAPLSAGDYGPFLLQHGFAVVPPSTSYVPEVGDIAVFSDSAAHPNGHIEVWTGQNWVSDFVQNNESPYSDNSSVETIYRSQYIIISP
jgi:hypothetical protein